jgi:hypothetical protein
LTLFGDGKNLSTLDNFNIPIVWSPQVNVEAAMVMPQIIFGGIAANQTLG